MKSFIKSHISIIFFIIGIISTSHPIYQVVCVGSVYVKKMYISTILYILISILISSISFIVVVKNESKSFFNMKEIFDSLKNHTKNKG